MRILATSQLPLGVDGEQVYGIDPLAFADAVTLFAQRAGEHGQALRRLRRRRPPSRRCADRSTACPWPSSWRRPAPSRCRSRRSPAASTTASACCATRPADVPSANEPWPRRSRGATTCSSPTTSVACGPSPASSAGRRSTGSSTSCGPSACPTKPPSTWSAGSSIDRSSRFERTDDGAVRYWLLDSVRTFALDRLEESGEAADRLGRARRPGSRPRPPAAESGRSGPRADPTTSPSPAPSGPTSTPRSSGPTSDDPLLGLTIAIDLGWAWVVLGDAVGAQRLRAALTAAGRHRPAGTAHRRVAARSDGSRPRPATSTSATRR